MKNNPARRRSGRGRAAGVSLWIWSLLLALAAAGCSSGGGPPAGSAVGPEIVEGGVIFRYYDTDVDKVHLVGDFNRWSATSDPMTDKNNDGEWSLFYPLKPGTYEYKFVLDGTHWIPDPRNPDSVSDGFEGRNSIVVVPTLNSP